MSLRELKSLLLFVMAIGAAAFFGGGSTFASFSAETSNVGSTAASGTLTMSNQVNAGTACLSTNAASQDNVNAACSAALTLTNVAPGVFGGVAQITVQNTGSIDASKFYLWAPYVNATLSAGISGTVTSLPITALEGTVTSGDQLVLSFGTHTQTFVAAPAGAAGGATAIPVNSQAANFAYPIGTTVTNTSSNTTASNTDCFDAKTTVGGTAGATFGTNLNFNPVTGNPFCGTALIFVQETTGGNHYCWLGKGSSPEAASGMCVAPISVTLTSALTAAPAITTLSVAALNGNVATGDSILVTSGSTTQTFVASANAYFGATTISVNSLAPGSAFPIGSTVTDPTALSSLNSDTTDTITNFNTGHNVTGKIQLFPLTGNGTVNNAATVELNHFNSGVYSRIFQVGMYLPAPAGINQNPLQGLQSTFGITWHIDQ